MDIMLDSAHMLTSTTFTLDGYRVREYLGIVRGIVVRAPTIAQGMLGHIKNVVGGRIGAYTSMCDQAREDAFTLMLRNAKNAGANAVLGLRFDAAEVVAQHSATEVLVYGTAVIVERTGMD